MSHLLQVAVFGVLVCAIAATALGVAPGFRPDRKSLGSRFSRFFWRYCLLTWIAMELAVWVFTGRPYP